MQTGLPIMPNGTVPIPTEVPRNGIVDAATSQVLVDAPTVLDRVAKCLNEAQNLYPDFAQLHTYHMHPGETPDFFQLMLLIAEDIDTHDPMSRAFEMLAKEKASTEATAALYKVENAEGESKVPEYLQMFGIRLDPVNPGFLLVPLDNQNRVIGDRVVYVGRADTESVSPSRTGNGIGFCVLDKGQSTVTRSQVDGVTFYSNTSTSVKLRTYYGKKEIQMLFPTTS